MNRAPEFNRHPPRATFVALLSFLLVGCASVPPASVQLSEQIGEDIDKSRAAHLSTLDAFYQRLQSDADAWIIATFLPRAIDNHTRGLVDACAKQGDRSPNCSALDRDDIEGLVRETVAFRDEVMRALDSNHDEAVRLISDHYSDLASSNATVTALLASAVDVRAATESAANIVSDTTGLDIDLGAIEQALDDYLIQAGRAGESVAALETQLSEVLTKAK